jgi:hypothetical protein
MGVAYCIASLSAICEFISITSEVLVDARPIVEGVGGYQTAYNWSQFSLGRLRFVNTLLYVVVRQLVNPHLVLRVTDVTSHSTVGVLQSGCPP